MQGKTGKRVEPGLGASLNMQRAPGTIRKRPARKPEGPSEPLGFPKVSPEVTFGKRRKEQLMLDKYPTISVDAITALRAVNLLSDAGTYTEECEASPSFGIPQHFIRCAGTLERPRLGFDRVKLEEIAKNIREATGDEAQMVLVSWHPDYGDYLRVRCESAAFQFICHMKS